jgi:hypothetical protein
VVSHDATYSINIESSGCYVVKINVLYDNIIALLLRNHFI